MLFASCYYAMLFTNWGNMTYYEADPVVNVDGSTSDPGRDDTFGGSAAPMWIKIITQWISIALYTVSISLPICCPDRVF